MLPLTIYWTCTPAARQRICERFGITPDYVNIAGETPADISPADLPLLQETERRGFLRIRNKPQTT